jgi:Mrp family chromosome partitioning ATPase
MAVDPKTRVLPPMAPADLAKTRAMTPEEAAAELAKARAMTAGKAAADLSKTRAMTPREVPGELNKTRAMTAREAPPDLSRTRVMPSVEAPIPQATVKMVRSDLAAAVAQYRRPAAPPAAAPPAAAPAAAAPQATAPSAPAIPVAAPAGVAAPPLKACVPTDDPRLMMLADPKGAQAAGFRVLRDTLVTKGLPRILAISSGAAGEGKTTCAINLAIAIAEHRTEKTLLLDASFTDPAIAGLLGIDETPTDGSAERAWCAPFVLSTLTPSLDVATVARRPGQAPSYIDFTTLARLLEGFQRAGYQHIILDTPPVESSPEAGLLLHLAGGVLLVVRSGSSTSGELRRAVERVGPEKALGVTLMEAP